MNRIQILLTISAFVAIVGNSAQAQFINVNVANSSFENPSLPVPGDYIGEGTGSSTPGYPIPDWVATAQVMGVQNGETAGLYGGANSGLVGSNFGWDDGSAPFYQILSGNGATIEAGTYTLTVALGQRPGGADAGGILYLYSANGSTIVNNLTSSGVVGATGNGMGTFADYTLTYVVAANDANIGDSIVIALSGANNKGQGGNPGNDDFDNVRLTFQAAPEPSTYALMIGGVFALAAVARSRKLAAIRA